MMALGISVKIAHLLWVGLYLVHLQQHVRETRPSLGPKVTSSFCWYQTTEIKGSSKRLY